MSGVQQRLHGSGDAAKQTQSACGHVVNSWSLSAAVADIEESAAGFCRRRCVRASVEGYTWRSSCRGGHSALERMPNEAKFGQVGNLPHRHTSAVSGVSEK